MGTLAQQGSLNVGRRTVPTAGPPFSLSAADNGLSVDVGTGHIVLGNDVGGAAAQLLNAREIDFNNFSIQFIDSAAIGLPGTTVIANGYLQVTKDFPSSNGFFGSATDTSGDFQINSDISIPGSTPPRLALATQIPADLIYLQNAASGFEVADTTGLNRLLRLDKNAGLYFFGDIDSIGNGTQIMIFDGANTVNIGSGGLNFFEADPQVIRTGDLSQSFGGMILEIDSAIGNQRIRFLGNDPVAGAQTWQQIEQLLRTVSIGDVDNSLNGNKLIVDDTNNVISFTNSATNVGININGVAGFTGTVTPVNTITVNNGIVTAVA
jgi:hypothetical protein